MKILDRRILLRPALAISAPVFALWLYSALCLRFGRHPGESLQLLAARDWKWVFFSFPSGLGIGSADPLPVFPLLWALPLQVLQPHWFLFRLVSLGVSALALWAVWKTSKTFLPFLGAPMVVFLVAANPVLVQHAGAVLPALLFMALVTALLGSVSRGYELRGWRWTAAAMASSLLSPLGVPLLLALAAGIWLRDGAWKAARFSAFVQIPLALWAVRARMLGQWAPLPLLEWSDIGTRMEQLGQNWVSLPSELGIPAAFTAALALCVLGAGVRAKKGGRQEAGAVAMAVFVVAVFFSPWAGEGLPAESLLAVLPILWLLTFAGVEGLGRRMRGVRPRTVFLVTALILAAPAIEADRRLLSSRSPGLAETAAETMAWIRQETDPAARFESFESPNLALFTGRWVIPPPGLVRSREEWLKGLFERKIDYVLLPFHAQGALFDPRENLRSHGHRWASASPRLRQVYVNPAEELRIYRFSR